MTYNVRAIQIDSSGIWDKPTYENRQPSGVVATIKNKSPDVVGLQEVNERSTTFGGSKSWFDDYLNASGGLTQNGYTMVKGKENGGGQYNPIYFKTSRFDLVGSGTYWLTSTPNTQSKLSGSEFYRIMTWAFLREKETGAVIMFVTTHLENGNSETTEAVRKAQAEYLVQYVKALNTGNAPVFIFGDFNSKYKTQTNNLSSAAKVITDDALWVDARVNAVTKINDVGTEAGGFTFDGRVLPIDLMFVPQTGCTVNTYEVVNNYDNGTLADGNDLFSGKYPSDHLPVIIGVTLTIN